MSTLLLNHDNASTIQYVSLLPTTAKHKTTLYVGEQYMPSYWKAFLNSMGLSRSINRARHSSAYQTMLASEDVLRKDWDSPEEDAAWADL